VKQQIKRLEDPAVKCCQLVYDELIRILGQLLAKVVRSKCFANSIIISSSVRVLSSGILLYGNASMRSSSTSSSN
jgi:hypothetical protein